MPDGAQREVAATRRAHVGPESPGNGRAMTRPTACGPHRMPRATSHQSIELSDGHDVFVAGDLKDGIGRRVDDGSPVATCSSPSSSMISVPGGGAIAEDAAADGRLERRDDLVRKAMRVRRERPLEDDAHHRPVPRRRVFAGAAPAQAAVRGVAAAAHPSGRPTIVSESEAGEVAAGATPLRSRT